MTRFNLPSDFIELEEAKGAVHSIFEHAINLSFVVQGSERLITLLEGDAPLLPESIILSGPLFYKIKNSHTNSVYKNRNWLFYGDSSFYLDTNGFTDLNLSVKRVGPCKRGFSERLKFLFELCSKCEKRSDLEKMPEIYQKALEQFTVGIITSQDKMYNSALRVLLGAGKGLTPACDDAIIGTLAVAYTFLADYNSPFEDDPGFLFSSTTRISAKYLKCAIHGIFSEPVCSLMRWLASGNGDPCQYIKVIKSIGHTSGMDILYGVQCALKETEKYIDKKGKT